MTVFNSFLKLYIQYIQYLLYQKVLFIFKSRKINVPDMYWGRVFLQVGIQPLAPPPWCKCVSVCERVESCWHSVLGPLYTEMPRESLTLPVHSHILTATIQQLHIIHNTGASHIAKQRGTTPGLCTTRDLSYSQAKGDNTWYRQN